MYILYYKRTRYIVYCVQDNGIFNIEQLLVSLFKSTTDYIVCFSDNLELTALKYQEIIHASIFMISRQLKSSIMNNIFSIHHFCEKLNIRRFYRKLIWLQYFINYGSFITYYTWLLDQKRNYIQKLSFINLTKLISGNSSTIFRFI